MKLLLKISYIGTNYCGFQAQENGTAIQNVLTSACEKVFSEKCNVTGSSRTDAGVHAFGFCVTVAPVNMRDNWLKIPISKVHRAFQKELPNDISVIAAASVEDDFHPRYSAKGKEYIYRIRDAVWQDPFENERSMKSAFKITDEKLAKMKQAAKEFIGTHDFSSFMGSGSKITDATRTVMSASVERNGNIVEFRVSADGFLYNMVRIMAGTLVDVAADRIPVQDVKSIIDSCDRTKAGVTAPPYGLYLNEVFYEEKIDWQCE